MPLTFQHFIPHLSSGHFKGFARIYNGDNDVNRAFNGTKDDRRVGLTSPPSVRQLSTKMWDPRHLTTLQAFKASYKDSFWGHAVAYFCGGAMVQIARSEPASYC
jgi:hypothetical protein